MNAQRAPQGGVRRRAPKGTTAPESPPTLRLQFVLGQGWASRLISWWGQSYGGWSHVDAVLPDGRLLGARSDAVGGRPPGVQIRPPDYEPWIRVRRVEIPAARAQVTAWESWLRSQIGRPYDRRGILDFALGRPPGADGDWFCSALQVSALQHCGRLGDLGVVAQAITPNVLAILASAIGGETTYSLV